MAYWLFQGNPKYYRVTDAIRDFEQMPWLVTRYGKEIAVGDGVLVWKAGVDAGVYAIAEIIESAKMLTEVPDIRYWIDKSRLGSKPQAQIRFTTKLLKKPLLREQLKSDSILKDLLVIRAPNSTNFKVSPEQWQRVHELKI
ncbi:MAG: EVE domain-containing protein [Lyngbya sp.]|nr:EVE domain-containing protein [Lyngbya sp.]